jgi:hypothetical protein
MVWVFYSEAILGHGWTFYEPNIPLAFAELGMAITGLVLLSVFMVQLVPSGVVPGPKHKLTPQERLSLLGRL